MNTKKLITMVLFSALLFTGCSLKNNREAIVKVNDNVITKAQFDKLFDETINTPALAMFGLNSKEVNKNSFMYLMVKDRVVNELIIRSLIESEMQKRNIKVTKKDTDAELIKIIDKIGSKEKFNEILKQNGITATQFKKDLTEEVKMKKLVELFQIVKVTEPDAKKYYNENVQKFKYPDRVRASHILIAANPEEIKETLKASPKNKGLSEKELNEKVNVVLAEKLKKAQQLETEVQKDPTAFAKLAKENSEDVTTAKRGGDLGFFAQQEMVEPFAKKAFSMKPNTISDIVTTPYGYHIIMVTDRMAAGQDSYEKVKDEIIMYLENQKRIKVLENFIESLKKNAEIEYVDKSYSPISIKDALKQQMKANPALGEQVDEANHSATPKAVPTNKK